MTAPYSDTFKKKVLEYARDHGVAAAQKHYGLPHATITRWNQRLKIYVPQTAEYPLERRIEILKYAAEHGFDAFCTTLTVSPYQNTPLIFETGEKLAAQHGVKFAPYDFSPHYREGQAQARELGLYMQKYCGCVFSEEDRYCKKKKKAVEA